MKDSSVLANRPSVLSILGIDSGIFPSLGSTDLD